MLQLPQSLAWLQDAPEPLVVVIERWIVVVPAKIPPDGATAMIAASTTAAISLPKLIFKPPRRLRGSLPLLSHRS